MEFEILRNAILAFNPCNEQEQADINDKIKVTKKGKIKITKIGYFFDCQK